MKIAVAYHGFLFGDHYKQVITDQFNDIVLSGLYERADKIYIGIVDTVNGASWVRDFWKGKPKAEIIVYSQNNELSDTMKWIRDYSKENPEDYVLFFHSKGLSHFDYPTEDWRRYMEYFTIERWRDCIEKLNEYDTCGIMWNKDTVYGYFPHFSGAFWWAKCSYINTLDHTYLDMDWKYGREMWIGTNKNVKVFEFHNSKMNDMDSFSYAKSHYSLCYDRKNYVHKDSLSELNREGQYFLTDKGVIHDYLPYYDLMFNEFRNKEINIFEIGYQYKGSLRLWEKYFLYAKIRAIDITEERPFIEDAKALNLLTEIETGSRVKTEIKDLNTLTKRYFKDFIPDIVIEDSSHELQDQLFIIRLIYPLLRKGGLLIIEDIQDLDNQKSEFEKLGYEFYIIDKRNETGRYDEVLLIFKK
jgi:hypothetical protein